MDNIQETINTTIEYVDILRFQLNNRCYELELLGKAQVDTGQHLSVSNIATKKIDEAVCALHIALEILKTDNKLPM